jgi:hypothetical protein
MASIEYFGVFATPLIKGIPFELEHLITEPVPALSYLRDKHGPLDSFKCPALITHLKNTYYITSPIDFTLTKVGENFWKLSNTKGKTKSLNPYLDVQVPESKLIDNSVCLNIGLQYYFVNNGDDVIMEVIDPPLVQMPLTNMPGEFNISKWYRPTNFTFFIDSSLNEVKFKRGDPLYAVRFRANNKTVKLSKIEDFSFREAILTEQMRATTIKDYYPGLKLEEMYELFKSSVKRIFK